MEITISVSEDELAKIKEKAREEFLELVKHKLKDNLKRVLMEDEAIWIDVRDPEYDKRLEKIEDWIKDQEPRFPYQPSGARIEVKNGAMPRKS